MITFSPNNQDMSLTHDQLKTLFNVAMDEGENVEVVELESDECIVEMYVGDLDGDNYKRHHVDAQGEIFLTEYGLLTAGGDWEWSY